MIEVLCVMTAGAVGALARWGTDNLSRHYLGAAFPWGTLFVNVLGCFLFGLFMQIDAQSGGFSKPLKLVVTSGFLGAFTTFSTFGFNTWIFIKDGHYTSALLNIGTNLILGILAVWGGATIAKFLN
ncbi:MAG: fluoride efflux transporter CrcB [Deltaproteobacteria bacterium]|nr:fluoride efflux transporter CrcB [Deltaproteobacteria bacterium]